MSEFREEFKFRVISWLAATLIRSVGFTGRFRVAGYDKLQKLIESGRGFIMAVWHGRTLLPVYYCREIGIWAIVSTSRDGELQARILRRLGYKIIRGSSRRGGMKAALTACKELQEGGILAITPDGPRGPANEVQEGVVFLAQHANCPIVPIGVGASPRKLMPAWDSYMFPFPFARCALVFGEPIYVTGDEPSDRGIIKTALDDLQREAQLMVKEGW